MAIAGAGGFVGRALIERLRGTARIIAIGRSVPSEPDPDVEWRACDLYSLLDAERALEGVDVAFYFVHSMLPSARLNQSGFADTDLILADNFARAASRQKVRQIIYLGGIIPEDDSELSEHLRSRLEVEAALGARKPALTALRAGLIVGPGGSSFQMLERLVRRLPVMLTPAWCDSRTQPVALEDILRALLFCINRRECFGRAIDVAGPDILTYREMIRRTAEILGKRRWLLKVPFFTPKLSRLWVSLVTGASYNLVAPLVESLRHDMIAREGENRKLLQKMKLAGLPFEESVRRAIEAETEGWARSPRKRRKSARRTYRPLKSVRSVQRLPRPDSRNAKWIARRYALWLPAFMRPFIQVRRRRDELLHFMLRPLPWPLLELSRSDDRSAPDRQLFYITGGILAARTDRGRLEFRITPDGSRVLAAIHDFVPTLPWYIYNFTQAIAHLWVMRGFGRYLAEVQLRDQERRRNRRRISMERLQARSGQASRVGEGRTRRTAQNIRDQTASNAGAGKSRSARKKGRSSKAGKKAGGKSRN